MLKVKRLDSLLILFEVLGEQQERKRSELNSQNWQMLPMLDGEEPSFFDKIGWLPELQ